MLHNEVTMVRAIQASLALLKCPAGPDSHHESCEGAITKLQGALDALADPCKVSVDNLLRATCRGKYHQLVKRIKNWRENLPWPERAHTVPSYDNYNDILNFADEVLGGYGVEAICCENCGGSRAVLAYVNMGDPYVSTLCFDCDKAEFEVCCWGDWLEEHETENHPLMHLNAEDLEQDAEAAGYARAVLILRELNSCSLGSLRWYKREALLRARAPMCDDQQVIYQAWFSSVEQAEANRRREGPFDKQATTFNEIESENGAQVWKAFEKGIERAFEEAFRVEFAEVLQLEYQQDYVSSVGID